MKWVVDIAVLVTMFPLVYPHPESPWIPVLEKILYNHRFIYAILAAYAAVDISYGVMSVVGKRTNPSLLMSASFLFFILIGSLVLMMPKCTVSGIGFIDSLFVSTSAVCITGLTTVDVSQTFTPTGLVVLAVMVQAGGLGVMTFTSFFRPVFQRQHVDLQPADGERHDLFQNHQCPGPYIALYSWIHSIHRGVGGSGVLFVHPWRDGHDH